VETNVRTQLTFWRGRFCQNLWSHVIHLVIMHLTHESLRRPSIHRLTHKIQQEASSGVIEPLLRMKLMVRTCVHLVLRAGRVKTTVWTSLTFWRERFCPKLWSYAHPIHKLLQRPSILIRRRCVVLTPLFFGMGSSVAIVCQ
jgi:hypothetical protein